jgi:25S rRNA (cytosine2278-C5)-methyltransferase
VLVHDLLCSKQGIATAKGPIKDSVLRHKTRLKSDYVRAQLSQKVAKNGANEGKLNTALLMTVFLPRWVRVNTLKMSLPEFIKKLDEHSLVRVADMSSLKTTPQGYIIDANVEDLLAFHLSIPVAAKFAKEYASGEIILQDKASCIPANLLCMDTGATVLDACAAPGNKTTQLAASVGPTGRVIAVEKDAQRAATLKNMVEKAGGSKCTFLSTHLTKVTTILNADFTTLDPSDVMFSDVTHILLDPSCSGSGLDRLEYNQSDSDITPRLRNLATFQTRLLKHALSFPSVEKVVYSTCSHHAEENEKVVTAVLNEMSGWRVLPRNQQPKGLKTWPRRGLVEECPSKDIAESCIRCEKGTDHTIGFFAVGFIRDSQDTEEEWQGIP